MPFQQTVVWTALPREPIESTKKPGRIYLSVFVSPRFEAPDSNGSTPPKVTLENFPDFKAWPELVRKKSLRFEVEFKKDDETDPKNFIRFSELQSQPSILRTPRDPAKSMSISKAVKAWQALFAGSEGGSFAFIDLTGPGHKVLTFSFRALEEMLKASYIQAGWEVAADPTNPNSEAHRKVLNCLQLGEDEDADLRFEIEKILEKDGVIDPRQPPECFQKVPERWHWALYKFAVLAQRQSQSAEPVPMEKQKVDLHEVFASVGEYPELMRDFGLAIDLELSTDSLLPDDLQKLLSKNKVRVNVAWPSNSTAIADQCSQVADVQRCDKNPWTACSLSKNQPNVYQLLATPSARGPQLKNWVLNLKHEVDTKRVYDVCQLDAVTVVPQIADPEARLAKDPPEVMSGDATHGTGRLPTLRSAGAALCWSGLASSVKKDLDAMKGNDALLKTPDSEKLTLFAEDLVRGYAIDVREETVGKIGVWRPLCARTGTYTFTKPGGTSVVAEQTYLDEEGWVSLGGTLSKSRDEQTQKEVDNLTIRETLFWWDGWGLNLRRPEKPLPDSPSKGEAPAAPNNLKVAFKRVKGSFPRLRFGSTHRLRARVVDLAGNRLGKDDPRVADESVASEAFIYGRFEPVTSPLAWARRSDPFSNTETPTRIVIKSLDDKPSPERSERHIVPPKVAHFMAETHGMLDEFIGAGKDKKVYQAGYKLLRERDSSLGKKEKKPDGTEVIIEPQYDSTGTLQIPYLPDPLSRGAIIYGLPGTSGCYKIDFVSGNDPHPDCAEKNFPVENAQWPNAKPFRIRLEDPCRGLTKCPDGPRPPEWDKVNRVLRVFLPKGEMADIEIRSFITKDDVSKMGLWLWVAEQDEKKPKDQKQAEKLRDAIVNGCHWMFTPCLKMTLVHAIPRPAESPQFVVASPAQPLLEAVRKQGESFVDLKGDVFVHGQSAEKIEIHAAWTEIVDDANLDPEHRVVSGIARPFELSLPPDNRPFPLRPAGQEETSPEDKQPIPKCRHEFGDTKYRRVTYSAVATPRHHDCFPAGTTMLTQQSAPIPIEVRSAARPDAPGVVYVIPTFGWKEKRNSPSTITNSPSTELRLEDGGITRTRSGGGLRVYLDRPWFRSGDGEQLGVVLYPGPLNKVPQKLLPFITQWGRDPVWDTNPIGTLEPGDFVSNLITPVQGQLLSEADEKLPEYAVTILPHGVDFDPKKGLWFSDVVINWNDSRPRGKISHTPFVRLALVRYQPNSLPGLAISPVVLADFAQLLPSRTTTIRKDSNVFGLVRIELSGNEGVYSTCQVPLADTQPSCADGQRLRPKVVVSVEKRVPFLDGELGWEEATFRTSLTDNIDRTSLVLEPAAGNNLSWGGQLLMPDEPNVYRIVIKEFELFPSDNGTRERLVYVDFVTWNG